MIDRDKIMVAPSGNIMHKTPQEAYDLIKNMTQHHFQWDAGVYYDTTTGVSAYYSETTSALTAQIEVLGKQTAYTIQSVQHQPGPGHPNTVYYSDSDKSDEDEPFKVLDIQKPIHSLSDNPIPSSDSVVESLFPLPTPFGDSDSLLEETDTLLSHFDDSVPDYEPFCFDIKEKSSGSTTSHSDHSVPDYEAFYFDIDHQEEKSSSNTTSHFNLSLLEYELFLFDLSFNPLHPADRRELTRLLKGNISDTSTKDLTINELNDFPLLISDCDSNFSEEFFEFDLLVSFLSGNKDKNFDPGIFIIKGVQSQRFHILPLDYFSTISFISDSFSLTGPSEIETYLSFPARNEDKVFDPGILLIDGVLSFTRKSPHLFNNNFKTDKRHISILKYEELLIKERKAQTIKENEKRLEEREIQQQESLVTEVTIVKANLNIDGTILDASLDTDSTTLDASLVIKGIALDASLVDKQSTIDSSTSSKQQDECNSLRNESSNSWNDAYADIGPSYDSDTVCEVHRDIFENMFVHGLQNHGQPESIPDTYVVNENNSNITSDIPNMDPDRDKEEHNYGLGFENKNDVENPSLLSKAKGLARCLYNIDEMGNDLISDHKIISEEELKCEVEKCLKVKHIKSPLSYHGFVYGESQFEEPPKVHMKRRNVNLKTHLKQAQNLKKHLEQA
uniref:Reverse transcriptase domain-containing protein n=1 Tax=Tanacetum cinerariifolium TaxID=118510 RepID=A0A6L2MNY6_TANCI|nr:hypothetical protein [Tanacetum cinerariifolium]